MNTKPMIENGENHEAGERNFRGNWLDGRCCGTIVCTHFMLSMGMTEGPGEVGGGGRQYASVTSGGTFLEALQERFSPRLEVVVQRCLGM